MASVGAKGLLPAVTSIQERPKAELGMLHPSETRSILPEAKQQLEFPLSLLLSQGDSRFLHLISSLSKISIFNNQPQAHAGQVHHITNDNCHVKVFFLFSQ